MFKDETLDAISIKSDILSEKYVRDQSCQTRPIEYKEKSVQSVLKTTSSVQTENTDGPAQVTRLCVDTSKKLSNFMLTVYPIVSEQLTANVRSHAFDDYELDELSASEEIDCVLTLNSVKDEQKITCLSWNSIGSIVASAFGCFEHLSWCTHHSSIHLWNVDRKDHSEPDKVIDTDNCITSLSFHPSDPPLLVGGDFSGKIYMWDLSKEDNLLVAFTGKESETHQESVNQIIWMPSAGYIVKFFSAGADGNLFFWMYNKLKKQIGLLSSFQLTSDVIPRSARTSSMRSGVAIGITCAALTISENTNILVGTENGAVFSCKDSTSSSATNSFTVSAFDGHKATVNAISIAKHLKHMFSTCSLDMCIHIYLEYQNMPIHKIDPLSGYLFDINWSFTKQTCFVTTSNGTILVYDVDIEGAVLKKTVVAADKKCLVNVVAMNQNDSNRFASSDTNGAIKIWKFQT